MSGCLKDDHGIDRDDVAEQDGNLKGEQDEERQGGL